MHQDTPTRVTTPQSTAERPPRGEGAAQGKARDAYFDNAKYLTIVLVACGHAWDR